MKNAKDTDKQSRRHSLSMIEAILMVFVCFSLAFVLIGVAALYSTGWNDGVLFVQSLLMIIAGCAVLIVSIKLLWWRYKRQKEKMEEQREKERLEAEQKAKAKAQASAKAHPRIATIKSNVKSRQWWQF